MMASNGLLKNIERGINMKTVICTFPDQTTIKVNVVQQTETEFLINYMDKEAGIQELHVPFEFIQFK